MSSRPVILEVRNLIKNFPSPGRDLEVLKGINFNIHENEIVSIVGKSGVGKSTLLNILGLTDTPTSGELLIRGKQVLNLNRREYCYIRNRYIGFVFQFYHLLADFTALENVMLVGMIHHSLFQWHFGGVKQVYRERAEKLLAQVGLSERLHHYPTTLSGGEQQRVAIARALANDPDVVLMDEPTGNLDEKTSKEIHELIWSLQSQFAKSFIMVTHDEAVADLANRKIRMVAGRVHEE